MSDVTTPIYLITGFLESGKTTFINFTVQQQYFQVEEETLLITCEEGEEEYDEAMLRKYNTSLEVISDPKQFTKATLTELAKKHRPYRVILEYNPLWGVKKLEQMRMPRGWEIVQHIVTVDASTFQVYAANMKSHFMEMTLHADMVIFNRSRSDLPLASFRRSIKVFNPGAEILFENEERELTDIFQDSLPYDLNADIVEVEDIDFGIFYVDLGDHPDDYKGKTVRYKGKVLKNIDGDPNMFVAGRMAMTCCAEDMTFIGYVCKSGEAASLKEGSWVEVTGVIAWETVKAYRGQGPVLYVKSVVPAKPPKMEIISFN